MDFSLSFFLPPPPPPPPCTHIHTRTILILHKGIYHYTCTSIKRQLAVIHIYIIISHHNSSHHDPITSHILPCFHHIMSISYANIICIPYHIISHHIMSRHVMSEVTD